MSEKTTASSTETQEQYQIFEGKSYFIQLDRFYYLAKVKAVTQVIVVLHEVAQVRNTGPMDAFMKGPSAQNPWKPKDKNPTFSPDLAFYPKAKEMRVPLTRLGEYTEYPDWNHPGDD